ncbi:hypothetical protein AMJ80_09750 [bacterium SM23_31]|nr:MAG: hypothetical protein AMJ80_09750 [bacterium SM23_31]
MTQNVKREISFLEKHISKDKDSVLFARLADKRLENDEVEKAIQICEQGLKKHPYYITGHLVMAKCYLAASFREEAKEELYRILTFDPYNVAANKLLSMLLKEEGDKNSAMEHSKSIILADPLNKDSENILKETGVKAPVTEKRAAVVEPESGILKEAGIDEEEALLEEDLEGLVDVAPEVEVKDEGAAVEETTADMDVQAEEGVISETEDEIEVSPEDMLTEPVEEEAKSEMIEEEVEAEETDEFAPEELEVVDAGDETIVFPEEETAPVKDETFEETADAALEDKKGTEPEAEESIIDEELDKIDAEEEVPVDLESPEEKIEAMQESEMESAGEDIAVEPEITIEEEMDLETEEAAPDDELVEDDMKVHSLDDKDLEEISEETPADIMGEEIELSPEEVSEVEESEPEIEVKPAETEDKEPAELEEEISPEAESDEIDISFEEYMSSDEKIDVKFDEDGVEHLDEPVIKSLDIEKDFKIHESLETEEQVLDAGEEAGKVDVSPPHSAGAEEILDFDTEEFEISPETAEEEIDTKSGLDEKSKEIEVSPADEDESVQASEDSAGGGFASGGKEDFSEFLKEDFIEDLDFEDSSAKKSAAPEDVEKSIDVSPDEKADEDIIKDIDAFTMEKDETKEDFNLEGIDSLEPIDFDEEDIGGEIATMTLSEIYISQDKFDKALQVLEILKEKEPDNPKIDEKIKEIKKNMNV